MSVDPNVPGWFKVSTSMFGWVTYLKLRIWELEVIDQPGYSHKFNLDYYGSYRLRVEHYATISDS